MRERKSSSNQPGIYLIVALQAFYIIKRSAELYVCICDAAYLPYIKRAPNRTDDDFKQYVHSNYLSKTTAEQIDVVAQAYPSDPSTGSPFGTGNASEATPEFKRLAAFQGDWGFMAPRRHFFKHTANAQPVWSYCWLTHTRYNQRVLIDLSSEQET